ncbi:MAG: GtrA family protein [Hyphomicrobiales bacterium]|nr:GtrA family protein [Hyphomicrobiales bacterium]
MPARAPETAVADALRFLVAGAVNTALTAAIYFVGLPFMSPAFAYSIAWVVGICFVMIVYPERVYVGGSRSSRTRLLFGALAVAVFFVGLVTLRLLVAAIGDPRIAFLMTLAITTVLNFLGGRALSGKGPW